MVITVEHSGGSEQHKSHADYTDYTFVCRGKVYMARRQTAMKKQAQKRWHGRVSIGRILNCKYS